MDLGDPTRSITPTLDGPVLAVLARSGRPLTVGEVAAETARGSEIGVRRCLARLVDQGVVQAMEMGRNRVHQLNREHVAASIATTLADLRIELWRRMRKELNEWKTEPLYACVFGSAARGDGDVDSDVDVLLVHPPFPGDPKPPRQFGSSYVCRCRLVGSNVYGTLRSSQVATEIDRLRTNVHSWSGNVVQIVDLSYTEWVSQRQSGVLAEEIKRDAVELVGSFDVGLSILTKTKR